VAQLRFEGVHKTYGEIAALRGLDLEIRDGELLALVGPSGSGKSTVLRVAAGLEQATHGAIYIGPQDVTRVPPARRNVSMLFPHLTARENIGFGLRARGVPRAEVARIVEQAAALSGCSEFLERKPYELSGGERQRVALSRALARRPDVYLLDEPLSNLDAQLRVETRAELKRLHRELGTTMVYVTHDQLEALTLGTRVAVLDDGILQQVGSPEEVYARPANRFVARFVGSPAINLVAAAVEDGKLRAGPFTFAPPSTEPSAERSLEIGIRPEHLEVITTTGEGTTGRVELVESAGNETFVHVSAGGVILVARVSPDLRLQTGDAVGVAADSRHVYVFDAETGALVRGLDR
jgi:multiple sugar transport system ATP-binding protein